MNSKSLELFVLKWQSKNGSAGYDLAYFIIVEVKGKKGLTWPSTGPFEGRIQSIDKICQNI